MFESRVCISDELAAQMCMLRVGDEITDTLFKDGSSPISENAVFGFVYEIAEGIFVLSTH